MSDLLHHESLRQEDRAWPLLNTSFNLHGYPIVRTPDEALHVFRQSGLEYLQLGGFIARKK